MKISIDPTSCTGHGRCDARAPRRAGRPSAPSGSSDAGGARRPVSAGTITAPKLASVVARRIEDDVVARGWPVGTVLGSETDLLERFGVSRAVLREAVRIVEHTGAARMRRGPGGGLVVSEPNRSAVVTAMSVVVLLCRRDDRARCSRSAARSSLPPPASRPNGAPATTPPELVERIDAIAAGGVVGPPQLNTLEADDRGRRRQPGPRPVHRGGRRPRRHAGSAAAGPRLDPPLTAAEGLAHLDGYRPVVAAIADGDGAAAARRMGRLIDAVADPPARRTPATRVAPTPRRPLTGQARRAGGRCPPRRHRACRVAGGRGDRVRDRPHRALRRQPGHPARGASASSSTTAPCARSAGRTAGSSSPRPTAAPSSARPA